MGKPFDVTSKHLIEDRLADWLPFSGRSADGPLRVVDSDISTITSAADKVLRIDGPTPWLMHLEMQLGPDAGLPKDLQVRNTLLGKRHGLPVVSVVVLLKRDALLKVISGQYTEGFAGEAPYLDFRYRVVKVWEEPLERLLAGGLATLPLAILTDEAEPILPDVLRRIDQRLRHEATPSESDILWVATFVLSGARYSGQYFRELMKMTQGMKDLPTYQSILEEGRVEGRVEGEQNSLIILATDAFGAPDPATLTALKTITDSARLERMLHSIRHAKSWQDLLALK